MFNMTRIGILLLLCTLAACVFAAPPLSDTSLAGLSSLVVVGKVTAVKETAGTVRRSKNNTVTFTAGRGQATLAVEQVLMGGKLSSLPITYQTSAPGHASTIGFKLKRGQRFLFFLMERSGKYEAFRAPRAVSEAAMFQKIIDKLPAVTLGAPAAVAFKSNERYTIHVTNRGAAAIVVDPEQLYLSGLTGAGQRLVVSAASRAETPGAPVTIPSGKTTTFVIGATGTLPAGTGPMLAHLRVTVGYRPAGAAASAPHELVASPPVTSILKP
jgi:hypothetical protein